MSDDPSGLPPGLVDPIAEYDHDEGRAVVGGFVYRGSAIPALVGKYVFGDFVQDGSLGRIFVLDLASFEIEELRIGADDRDLDMVVKGFGVDAAGELYVVGNTSAGSEAGTGVVRRLVPVPEPALGLLLAVGLTLAASRGRSPRARMIAHGVKCADARARTG